MRRIARENSAHLRVGGLTGSSLDEVEAAVRIYDLNRPLSHIPKVELVKGDLVETAPRYVKDNPHLVVAMLYLDVDLYEPTYAALATFLPRMPKGAIVVFDQLNAKIFPGETMAVDEVMGLKNIRIERFPFEFLRVVFRCRIGSSAPDAGQVDLPAKFRTVFTVRDFGGTVRDFGGGRGRTGRSPASNSAAFRW